MKLANMLPWLQVLPLLAGVLQGGQVTGRAVPQWMVNNVLLGLGIAPRDSSLPTPLLTGLQVAHILCQA